MHELYFQVKLKVSCLSQSVPPCRNYSYVFGALQLIIRTLLTKFRTERINLNSNPFPRLTH